MNNVEKILDGKTAYVANIIADRLQFMNQDLATILEVAKELGQDFAVVVAHEDNGYHYYQIELDGTVSNDEFSVIDPENWAGF